MRKICFFEILSTAIFFGLLFDIGKASNLTKDECLSIERITIPRRSPKIVNVTENSPAYLHCTIGNAATTDNLVAWTRLTDDALLTAGGRSFTMDSRFQISPKRQTQDWVLIIRRVRLTDQGCYLCEINTEPLSTLIPVFLQVIPEQDIPKKANLKRNSNLLAKMEGNILILNCTFEGVGSKTTTTNNNNQPYMDLNGIDIWWTKNNSPIELRNNKYISENRLTHDGSIISILRITQATNYDNGLYACEGENLDKSTQMVYVNKNRSIRNFHQLWIILFGLIILLFI